MNTAELVVGGGLCGLVIVCMFIWIGIASVYMAYTKMDVMLGCLKEQLFSHEYGFAKGMAALGVSCYWLVGFLGLLRFPAFI